MPEGLKIQVGADVSQAVRALSKDIPAAANTAAGSFTKLASTATTASTAVSSKFSQSTKQAGSAITALANTLKTTGASGFTILGESGVLAGSKLRSLSGVLNTTATQIPTLSNAANNGAASFFKIAGAFGVGQLAGNLLIGVLDGLKTAIFGADALFSKAEISAGKFGNMMRDIKADVENFKDSLEFKGKVQKLQNELAGLKGPSLTIANNADEIGRNVEGIEKIKSKIAELRKEQTGLSINIGESNAALRSFNRGNSTELDKLIKQFGSIENIPVNFIKKLDEAGVSAVTQFQAVRKEVKSLENDLKGLQQGTLLNLLNIPVEIGKAIADEQEKQKAVNEKAAQDAKALSDKRKADYEKYVSDTISEAKKLSDAFKNQIDLKLDVRFFDTKQQEFEKSLKFLDDFKNKKFSVTIDPELKLSREDLKKQVDLINFAIQGGISITDIKLKITPEVEVNYPPPEEVITDNRTDAERFAAVLGKEYTDYFKDRPVDVTIDAAVRLEQKEKDRANILKSLFPTNTLFADLPKELFSGIEAGAIRAATVINNILQPAFAGLFDAIKEGENPLKAFFKGIGDAVSQLIKKLISAAITAAILSAVLPGGIGGAKGFGAIFGKILGFASGGLVTGPQLALIGEGSGTSRSNPEVVAPLDKLRGMLAGLGGGGQLQRVVVTGRLRGNDMILQNARTSRAQGRAGVR